MRPELQRGFAAVERQRAALQSRVLALSDAQRQWTPNAAVWSIRQIVEHLVLSDETVGQAHEAVETEARMFRVLPRAWRRALVLGALNRNTVLPLPSPAMEPRGDVPMPELFARWDTSRREMGRVLETGRGNEPRYFHPVLGPLTAAQMLALGQAHMAYHTRQIDTLQSDSAFPVALSS